MKNKKMRIWEDLPIGRKILLAFAITSFAMFIMNLFMYWQVNKTIKKIDQIYASNVNLNNLEDAFSSVQEDMYAYLTVKSSSSLENYYRSEQIYRDKLEQLNNRITDNEMLLLEKNIREMSETYLIVSGQAVQAKRGRNVEKYKEAYEETLDLYEYINSCIYELNNLHFGNNASSYVVLTKSLRLMEILSSLILVIITFLNCIVLTVISRNIASPLARLSESAVLVGEGNFDVEIPQIYTQDEVGVVTKAFNKMVHSLKIHMEKTKESMEKERKMKERELLMETHLKDAQLKYLQAQINPHFLFNSLNAGAQLAMMEDAEQTCLFIESMADFFRYNVKKVSESSTLREELDVVDNYIYILNVRFAGDIHFNKSVDERVLDQKMPSMLLQPIVENAVNHGIRNVEWEGKIHLEVKKDGDYVRIRVADNGRGMTMERIAEVLEGQIKEKQKNSSGVAMTHVIHRLELYYERKDLLSIHSEGLNKGTEVIVLLPIQKKNNRYKQKN